MRSPLVIQSRNNPRITRIAGLKDSRQRRELGLFIVEGWHEVSVAMEANVAIQSIVSVSEASFEQLRAAVTDDVETLLVSPSVFDKLSMREHPDGILLVCVLPAMPTLDEIPKDGRTILVLDGLEKPGNHGAILRSAAAFGINTVVLNEGHIDPFHPNVIRNSRGHSLKIAHYRESAKRTDDWLRSHDYRTYVASPHASQSLHELTLHSRVAIVLGAEHEGVSGFWELQAQQPFHIRMIPGVDSLNVAVSASIVLYEVFNRKN